MLRTYLVVIQLTKARKKLHTKCDRRQLASIQAVEKLVEVDEEVAASERQTRARKHLTMRMELLTQFRWSLSNSRADTVLFANVISSRTVHVLSSTTSAKKGTSETLAHWL